MIDYKEKARAELQIELDTIRADRRDAEQLQTNYETGALTMQEINQLIRNELDKRVSRLREKEDELSKKLLASRKEYAPPQ